MTYADWYVTVLLAIFAVLIGLSYAPFWQRILVLWIGWFVGGLGIPEALDAKLRRRAALRSRWGYIGSAIGVALAFASLQFDGGLHGVALLYTVLGSGMVGQGLGMAVSSLVMQLGVATDGPRIARARVVVVRDYIPLSLHALAWLAWVAGTAVTVVESASRSVPVQSIAIDALAGVCLLTFEISSRAIVRRGQPAASTDELIWDDALRSNTLRDLLQFGVFPIIFGTLATATHGTGGERSVGWVGVAVVLALVLAEAFVYRTTRSYYLERLWPHARRRTAQEEAERDAEQPASA